MIDVLITNSPGVFWTVLKLAFLVGILLYVIFAYVVLKQVRLMNETLEIGFEKVIATISYLHFAISILVLILAVIIL